MYLHGLEGDANGTKGRWMQSHLAATAPQMPATNPDGRLEGRPECFEACVEVARTAVARDRPAVLVGSSFGGAVTMALMQRGHWQGPCALLAPAIVKYGMDPRLPEGCSAIVIHATDDDIVPYADSELLVRTNPNIAELWPTLGGHRLHGILDDDTLGRAVGRLASAPLR
jgi:pimeloyl-ACP methyl ester carboxylesterase